MIDPKDEKWLKEVLKDCFDHQSDEHNKSNRDLEGFRILIGNLLKNIEKNVDETRALWEREPGSKKLRERFCLLEKCLLYLRRFCKPR